MLLFAFTAKTANSTDDSAEINAEDYNKRVSRPQNLQILACASVQNTHTHGSPHNPSTALPLLPPACAILPTPTLGKIIRWLADILSIFLSWLRALLALRSLKDVLTVFLSCRNLPCCKRGKVFANPKQFIKKECKAFVMEGGRC